MGYLFRIGLIGFVTTVTHRSCAGFLVRTTGIAALLDLSLMQINLLDLISRGRGNFCRLTLFAARPMSDAQQLVNTMTKILLATVAIVAFSAPSFAAETAKTVGQAPPSFYLAQDTATLKCQIVETQPVAGGSMKVVGAAHSTKASAETALKADKTCAK